MGGLGGNLLYSLGFLYTLTYATFFCDIENADKSLTKNQPTKIMAIIVSENSNNNNAVLDQSNIADLITALSSVINLPAGTAWDQVSQIEIFIQDNTQGSILIQTRV